MKKQRWLRLPRLRTGLLLLVGAMCASIAFADAYPDTPQQLIWPLELVQGDSDPVRAKRKRGASK